MMRRSYHRAQLLKPGFAETATSKDMQAALPADQTLKSSAMLNSAGQSA